MGVFRLGVCVGVCVRVCARVWVQVCYVVRVRGEGLNAYARART